MTVNTLWSCCKKVQTIVAKIEYFYCFPFYLVIVLRLPCYVELYSCYQQHSFNKFVANSMEVEKEEFFIKGDDNPHNKIMYIDISFCFNPMKNGIYLRI